jgi:hypothetical protein
MLSVAIGAVLVAAGLASSANPQPTLVNRTTAALMAFEDLATPLRSTSELQEP